MSFEEFDQTPAGGWRALAEKGEYREAARMIDRYMEASPSANRNKDILYFHAGQMYAFANNYDLAEKRFKLSFKSDYPGEIEALAKQWNAYVNATIAFLQGNRKLLEKHRDEIKNGADDRMAKTNGAIVDRLIENLGKPYSEAYSGH